MPRQVFFLDQPVIDRLKKHTKERYGNRRAFSMVVQLAVVDYLDKEEGKSGKKKQTTTPRVKTL